MENHRCLLITLVHSTAFNRKHGQMHAVYKNACGIITQRSVQFAGQLTVHRIKIGSVVSCKSTDWIRCRQQNLAADANWRGEGLSMSWQREAKPHPCSSTRLNRTVVPPQQREAKPHSDHTLGTIDAGVCRCPAITSPADEISCCSPRRPPNSWPSQTSS